MKRVIAAICLIGCITVCQAQLRLYPNDGDKGLVLNTDYEIKVREAGQTAWLPLTSYQVEVDGDNVQKAAMATFDMNSAVEVQVSCKREGIDLRTAQVAIRPLSKNIVHRLIDNYTIQFTLNSPAYLSIEFGGDRKHNLHLFANPMETEVYTGTEAYCINWKGENAKDIFSKDAKLIYFGPGVHKPKDLPSKEIKIPSNTTVYLAAGAVVKAKLCIDHAKNVRIIGRGFIDHPLRGIEITHSSNVTVDGVTVINPEHYTVFGGDSENITLRNIKSFSCKPWSDGFDLMSCRNVTIDNIFLRTSDDCLAIYNHRWWYWGNTKNVTVTRAVLWADVAHNINLGTHGDDKSKKGEVMDNLSFSDIDVLNEDEDNDHYRGVLAISCGDKNRIQNVLFEDIRVEEIEEGRLINLQIMFNDNYNRAPGGHIRNITFRNISYNGDTRQLYPSWIKGYNAEHQISNIHFSNITINGERLTDLNSFVVNEFVKEVEIE